MVDNPRSIKIQPSTSDSIDFNKLKIVFLSSWLLLIVIVATVNVCAYLVIRYTKNFYQSTSVLKLDVNKQATEFGIKSSVVEDPSLNLIAGEIEIIQSRLFLNRVLDSAGLEVSYFSVGRVLDDELYQTTPFRVEFKAHNENFVNTRINIKLQDDDQFLLSFTDGTGDVRGTYGKWFTLDGIDLKLEKNDLFVGGDEIGYYFVINSKDALVAYLLNNLTAEPLNYNANTIQISFKDHNPFKARAILNKVDSNYLQFSNEQKNLATRRKIEWITNELATIEGKMTGYENYFENFTLQNKSNNLDADLQKTVLAINVIDSQRYDMNQRMIELDNLIENIAKGNFYVSISQRIALPESLTTSLERLDKLYTDQEKLKLSYNEITFAYREKEREIDILKEKVTGQLAMIKEGFQKRYLQLNQNKARLEYEFSNLPDKSTQFSKNLRYYKLYEQFYLSLMQSKSEFEITQAGTIPDFKILSPAMMPSKPLSPNKLMIAGIGFVASIVLALFVLGTMYMLNDRIMTLSEIERHVSTPILGVVPATSWSLEKAKFHILDHPRSMVSESIRTLRTNLDFFNIHSRRKVITVSSTVSGEGKSFIAVNLGGVIAMSNKRVLLVDLDMRKPKDSLAGQPVDRSAGVSTVLINRSKWQDCVAKTTIENFDYLPSGPHPPNPSELLMNNEFSKLLGELKEHYDYVILDTPPVGLVTDGIMAMKHSDISIYIFRANYSKKDFLFNLQRIININKFSNITTLLNALPNQGDQNYGYGYYEEPPRKSNWLKKSLQIFKG
ncbi:polysaccharide biosynthesis tyrosine autokinase [Chryseolinea sp. T2]|uniref:polysaccharide biosynthesis tyrosine autokinase n=1 Tax=Chryseolinea sp. T2 TaxID=3129255 RepID=UPI003076FDF0